MTDPASHRHKPGYRRRSERVFRRSRAAQSRRRASDASDFKFIRLMLQLSVMAALCLIGLGLWAQKTLTAGDDGLVAFSGLAQPWALGLTVLEALALLALLILTGFALIWRFLMKKGS